LLRAARGRTDRAFGVKHELEWSCREYS